MAFKITLKIIGLITLKIIGPIKTRSFTTNGQEILNCIKA